MKDDVVVTSTKTRERAKYIRKKGIDVARTSGIANKVTYDVTNAKAQEKAKENVNVVVETSKKTYKATAQNKKAAFDVTMKQPQKLNWFLIKL